VFAVLPATPRQTGSPGVERSQRPGSSNSLAPGSAGHGELPASSAQPLCKRTGTRLGELIGLTAPVRGSSSFRHPSSDQAQHRQHQGEGGGPVEAAAGGAGQRHRHIEPLASHTAEQKSVAPSAVPRGKQPPATTRPSPPARGAAVHALNRCRFQGSSTSWISTSRTHHLQARTARDKGSQQTQGSKQQP